MYGSSRGFSLVELLIGLIIISCVIAAFAPIMSKKLSMGVINSSTSSSSQQGISEVLLSADSMGRNGDYYTCDENYSTNSDGSRYLNCKLKNLPNKINMILSGAGGAGASAIGGALKHIEKDILITSSNNEKTIAITPDMKNIKITLVGGGGSGGGGFLKVDSTIPSVSACANLGAVYIPKAYNGAGGRDICVMSRNIGENDADFFNDSGVRIATKVSPGSNCDGDECCWGNGTAYTAATEAEQAGYGCTNNTSYPGCTRTVCKWNAAKVLCDNYNANGKTARGDWRLPSKSEIESWKDNFNSANANNKLQLCSWTLSATNIDRCWWSRSQCGGDRCNPGILFGEYNYDASAYSDDTTYAIAGITGFAISFANTAHSLWYKDTAVGMPISITMPSSARCVLGTVPKFTAHAGGGGAAGVIAKNIEIPSNIVEQCSRNNTTCTIEFDIAQEQTTVGKGGLNLPAENGMVGKPTSVTVKMGSNILWSFSAGPGLGGYGAKEDSSGDKIIYKNICMQAVDGNTPEVYTCPTLDIAQTALWDGQKGTSPALNETTTFYQAIGGLGGSLESHYSWGKGGKGGSVLSQDAQAQDLNGQKGGAGMARISYDLVYPGASGGGGGSGGFIKVLSINTNSSEVDVKIGLGGMAASFSDGKNGGNTQFATNYIAYGGKGGKTGIAKTDTTPLQQGTGGLGGTIIPASLIVTPVKKGESSVGENGKNALSDSNILQSFGGGGAKSAISISMSILDLALVNACGGFEISNCHNSLGGITADGSYFEFSPPQKPYNESGNYGTAGFGGGGGGWKYALSPYIGKGGNGTDGYMYVWW